MNMAKPNGYVIYRGPSELDGKPIVVVATGFRNKSENVKTGKMVQTWILREDISPREAVHSGQDSSICGQCPHRGILVRQADGGTRNKLRTCYVLSFQAPLQVWRTYQAGNYGDAAGDYEQIAELFQGRIARLGAYGDPAAVPDSVWAVVTGTAAKWAGYTHQWSTLAHGSLLRVLVMASVDSVAEAQLAQSMGWRTFRVGEGTAKTEVGCPASEEMGKRAQCADCTLCQGAFKQAKNIVIRPHGNRSKQESVARRRLVVV